MSLTTVLRDRTGMAGRIELKSDPEVLHRLLRKASETSRRLRYFEPGFSLVKPERKQRVVVKKVSAPSDVYEAVMADEIQRTLSEVVVLTVKKRGRQNVEQKEDEERPQKDSGVDVIQKRGRQKRATSLPTRVVSDEFLIVSDSKTQKKDVSIVKKRGRQKSLLQKDERPQQDSRIVLDEVIIVKKRGRQKSLLHKDPNIEQKSEVEYVFVPSVSPQQDSDVEFIAKSQKQRQVASTGDVGIVKKRGKQKAPESLLQKDSNVEGGKFKKREKIPAADGERATSLPTRVMLDEVIIVKKRGRQKIEPIA